MQNSVIVFIHGLNSYGDDNLHLGPAIMGRMDEHLRRSFETRGFRFISINGVGLGSPDEQATIAVRQIETLSNDVLPSGSTIHLLGNSMGGLVVRALAHRWKTESVLAEKNLRLGRIISWGTPHRGTRASDYAGEFPERNPLLAKSIAKLGYRVDKGVETSKHCSPRTLDEFNLRYPLGGAGREDSFVCAVPLRDVSPWWWGLYGYIHGLNPLAFAKRLAMKTDTFSPSDGFITVGSQAWGERHGPYALDHFAQIGFFKLLPPRGDLKERAAREFERLCDDMTTLIRS